MLVAIFPCNGYSEFLSLIAIKTKKRGFHGNLEMGLSQKLRKRRGFRGWMIMNCLCLC